MSLLSILAQDDGGGGSAAVVQLLILLMIPLAMYFLMIRPQRRRMREQQSMQRSIEVGDEVITTSGMYGFVTGIEDSMFWLEIDDDVQVRIDRAAVQRRVAPTATSDVTGDDVAKSDPQ
jgi:preprotein translocase subunit YajC